MSGTEPTPTDPGPSSLSKITDAHRAKLAVVYVRQSTPQQVAENRGIPRSPVRSGGSRPLTGLADRACPRDR